MADPDRAADASRILAELADATEELAAADAEHRSAVRDLNADPDATRAEFSEAFARHDAVRGRLSRRMVDLRSQLAEVTTDAEWAGLTSSDS